MKRKCLSKRARFEVFKRDGFVCQYCGAHPPDATLEVDHIVPVAEGGPDDPDNLVTACLPCNRGKAAIPLTSIPESLEEKAAMVAEREEQLRGFYDVMEARRARIESEMWWVAEVFDPEAGKGHPREYLEAYKRFNEKLGVHAVIEAAEIAMARGSYYRDRRRFRYFCGICWNKVRDMEQPHGKN